MPGASRNPSAGQQIQHDHQDHREQADVIGVKAVTVKREPFLCSSSLFIVTPAYDDMGFTCDHERQEPRPVRPKFNDPNGPWRYGPPQ